MEPKFQSSFIPKGPAATSGMIPKTKPVGRGGLYSYIATTLFVISFVLMLVVFGYKLYVKGNINSMGEEIEMTKNDLIPNTSREFIRLNNRINSVETLLTNHTVVSPLFEFLSASTVRLVRFREFTLITTPAGAELVVEGVARGYATLALQADIFNKSGNFTNPVFSDLRLDERGDVVFTFRGFVNPALISYAKEVESLPPSLPVPVVEEDTVATTTPLDDLESTPNN